MAGAEWARRARQETQVRTKWHGLHRPRAGPRSQDRHEALLRLLDSYHSFSAEGGFCRVRVEVGM